MFHKIDYNIVLMHTIFLALFYNINEEIVLISPQTNISTKVYSMAFLIRLVKAFVIDREFIIEQK